MHERPGLFRMALDAGHILRRRLSQLPGLETTVRIVAITALDHALIHAMVKRPIELLFDFEMAAVAELRLLLLQQSLAFFRVVGRVAVNAAHIVLQVRGPRKITVFFSVGMAGQAALAGRFRRNPLEGEDLALIAATGHVLSPRSVAAFATLVGWPALLVQRGLPMRAFLPIVIDVLVAGFAGLRTDILRWVGVRRSWGGRF